MNNATRFAAAGFALFVLVVASLTMPAWRVSAKANLRECQGEALKAFGQLRKANEQGVFWPPHQFENEYVLACMSARGFKLREEPQLASIRTGEYALHIGNPDSWSWDITRLLPRFLRG